VGAKKYASCALFMSVSVLFFSLLRRIFFSFEIVVTAVYRCSAVMVHLLLSPVPAASPPAVKERVARPGPGGSLEGGGLGCLLAIPPPILVRPAAGLGLEAGWEVHFGYSAAGTIWAGGWTWIGCGNPAACAGETGCRRMRGAWDAAGGRRL